MRAPVEQAITQIRTGFPEHPVQVLGDADGGAFVIVEELALGQRFAPTESWIGFHIVYAYPAADIYPHWLRPDLAYADGRAIAPPLHCSQTMPGFDRPAVMLSRRANRWNPGRDTAVHKLHRVLAYLRGTA